jgi:hypothetical protein
VNREHGDRHAADHRCQPAEDPGLGAVGVHDVGPLAADQRDEFEQAECVSHRMQRPAHVAQLHEPNTGSLRSLDERPVAMRGDDHVEAWRQSRQECGDVGLRAARLGERDYE